MIDWVGLDDGPLEAVLVIAGCQTACVGWDLEVDGAAFVLFVMDDHMDPQEVVEILMRRRA